MGKGFPNRPREDVFLLFARRLRPTYRLALSISVSIACTEAPSTEPAPDVFVADLVLGDSMRVGVPRNITNNPGYDNQPFFTPDGTQLLYTSARGGQTDIYRYDLETGTNEAVTTTPESEYSPTPLPGEAAFSTIRVEQDSTQRLWAFDINGQNPRLLLPDLAPVGYHAWVDSVTVALFVLGMPPTLQLTSVRDGKPTIEAEDIGRSLHRIPGMRAVSYVRKISDDEWWIMAFDLDTNSHGRLIRTPAGQEDYAWTPDGTLLMANGTILSQWRRGSDTDWTPVADLAIHGLGPITRLAVSPLGDRIALVSDVR